MRDWTKGELQALSAAAKLLIFVGLFAAIFQANDGKYLGAAVGALAAILGLTLGIWLMRYQKRTGKSGKPFAK